VFFAIENVAIQKPKTRLQAQDEMKKHVKMEGVRQFLSKSLYKDKNENIMAWRFNVTALKNNYARILEWNDVEPITLPTLFIKGSQSDYIRSDYQTLIEQQFPNAKAHIVANTGHWLHAEKTTEVLRAIHKFYDSTNHKLNIN